MCSKKNNLILIGMPGCGKSTIGKNAAKILHMDFIDVDAFIENREEKSISEIFLKGESHFRAIEAQVINELSSVKNTVISTGGGVVKNEKNMAILRNTGLVLFIDRPIDNILSDINTESRPLLKDKSDALLKLYSERIDLYKKFCHTELKNTGTMEDILSKVIFAYREGKES